MVLGIVFLLKPILSSEDSVATTIVKIAHIKKEQEISNIIKGFAYNKLCGNSLIMKLDNPYPGAYLNKSSAGSEI